MKIGLKLALSTGLAFDDEGLLLELAHHLFGDFVSTLSPNIDDFIVALTVGDQTFVVLIADLLHLRFSILEKLSFAPE